MALGGILPAIGGFMANMVGGLFGQSRQADYNMELAKYQNEWNEAMWRKMNRYNSPVKQMERFREAGLNPHLMYNQGNPGNASSSPRAADMGSVDMQSTFANLGTQLAQLRLMESQADLTDTKVQESTVKQDLAKAQTDLVKANPYMRKEYVDSMVMNLQAIADLKMQERGFMLSSIDNPDPQSNTRGYQKMQAELTQMFQRLGLNDADKALKAKVLESKEFENALKEIQVKWMQDADITPQHIYQGIMLILGKMMR